MQLLLKDKLILEIESNGICMILDFDRLPFLEERTWEKVLERAKVLEK